MPAPRHAKLAILRPEGGDRNNVDAVGARVGLRAAGHDQEQVGPGQVHFIFLGGSILHFWDTWLFILGKHWVCPDGVDSRRRGIERSVAFGAETREAMVEFFAAAYLA